MCSYQLLFSIQILFICPSMFTSAAINGTHCLLTTLMPFFSLSILLTGFQLWMEWIHILRPASCLGCRRAQCHAFRQQYHNGDLVSKRFDYGSIYIVFYLLRHMICGWMVQLCASFGGHEPLFLLDSGQCCYGTRNVLLRFLSKLFCP